jgi:O-methyltransferase
VGRSLSRTAVRRGLDRAMTPLGARLVSAAEDRAHLARYRDVVEQLYAVCAAGLSPPLRDRPGRIDLLCGLIGTEVSEAIVLVHHLRQALEGPGDVCEFGVAQGATSALLADEIRAGDRRLWLYDSFQGLSVPHPEKDRLIDDIFGLGRMDRYAGTMASAVTSVRGRLA